VPRDPPELCRHNSNHQDYQDRSNKRNRIARGDSEKQIPKDPRGHERTCYSHSFPAAAHK
jgi:hypothetical protein